MVLQYMNRKAGKTSSAIIWTYWLIEMLATLPKYYRVMLYAFGGPTLMDDQVSVKSFVLTAIIYPLIVTSFVLNCFADIWPIPKGKRAPNPSPLMTAPPLSALVFEWMTSFIIRGYKRYITEEDLYDPLPYLKSSTSYKSWVSSWDEELRRAKYNPEDGSFDPKFAPSLFKTLIATFWPSLTTAFIIILIRSFVRTSPALVLNLVTSFMEDESQPLWKGISYAVLLFSLNTVASFCFRHSDYVLAAMGIKIKGVLMAAIYQKALRISAKSQGRYTVGELVNLVSIDADKVLRLSTSSSMTVAAPMTIILTIILLWQYLGPSCLAGVAVIVLMMPLSGFLAAKNRQLQERQMKLKDGRLKSMNEIISSIKILKLFAWEPPFTARVESVREKEVSMLKRFAYMTAGIGFFWTCTPFLVGLMSFMTFVLVSPDNILTPTVAFVSLTLFYQMRFSMVTIPDFISNATQTAVSFGRIWKFLMCEEMNPRIIGSNPQDGDAITMRNVTATWGGDSLLPTLAGFNLNVPNGKLLAIVGPVGSGKSSVLSSMLGDLSVSEGRIDISGSIAYVPQQAWIQNLTIKENIIFTSEFERRKYEKVLDACCLRPDLGILPGGDQTEIGEKGINLSGGQRQRVALARAAYQNKDIYLFDDPLSALDAHVGKSIFNSLMSSGGMLRKKTRVLVTNNLSVIPDVDYIVVLKEGEIVERGTYADLMNSGGVLAELLKEFDIDESRRVREERAAAVASKDGDSETPRRRAMSFGSEIARSMSIADSIAGDAEQQHLERFQLVAKETVETGIIKWSVYKNYFMHVGFALTFLALSFYIGFRTLDIVSGLWLSAWSEDKDLSAGNRNYRLGIYAVIGVCQGISNFCGVAFLTKATITAATELHKEMLRSVMRAPLSFFDTTPMGRLLNRFGKDLDQLDVQLPLMANFMLEMFFQIIGVIVLISTQIPIFLVVAIPIMSLFVALRQIFVRSLRQLKRLEAVTRSPVYSHFSETINGLSSIRGFGVAEVFQRMNGNKVDTAQNCSFHVTISNYWMSIRLEFLGNLLIFVMIILVVTNREYFDAGTAGLLISYSLNSVVAFNFFVYFSTEVEATIVAAERLDEYTNVPPEADWVSDNPPESDWPQSGAIAFESYSTRYRTGLDLILEDVNLSIEPQQKIGVVGRTGAGKSSLILTIFRIIEAVKGRIIIDGIDISKIGLHELRSRLTIIPQESVLFNASLRFNLDPNDEYTDEDLWQALERAHLKTYFENQNGLDTPIAEGGGNISVGQRQLVCLARAVLRKRRILVLDEATASVDLETDALIQETIRSAFSDSTIITIAHRINTILDSDIVVLMSAGHISEIGPPRDLLSNPSSEFAEMAREAGVPIEYEAKDD
ncbi:multidrug resistance-associated protein 1 [Galendromus occidentalis]|uniref:Multidrug resistance-associated protein 1 n=1 Tax=Galendromus occidentalis TaxID=34638 RepID=A0AAJ7SD36_9ACAR|nr:multidrug resistance-associated protein 1 [Galendromus occidentalis]